MYGNATSCKLVIVLFDRKLQRRGTVSTCVLLAYRSNHKRCKMNQNDKHANAYTKLMGVINYASNFMC